MQEYAHPSEGPPVSSYDEMIQDIDFKQNAKDIIDATKEYFNNQNKPFHVPDEVIEWIKGLRPAHRVRLKVFQSILAHHHVRTRITYGS